MPVVPRNQTEAYRQWAKDNAKAQMDERAWVHESDWQEFLLSRNECEHCGMGNGDIGVGCRVCDRGYYG